MGKGRRPGPCPRCPDGQRAPGQGFCAKCRAEMMRERRAAGKEKISDQERRANRARAYANTYLRRGLITRQPCEVDGCDGAPRMHHDNFDEPLAVRWRCIKHRIRRGERGVAPDRSIEPE